MACAFFISGFLEKELAVNIDVSTIFNFEYIEVLFAENL